LAIKQVKRNHSPRSHLYRMEQKASNILIIFFFLISQTAKESCISAEECGSSKTSQKSTAREEAELREQRVSAGSPQTAQRRTAQGGRAKHAAHAPRQPTRVTVSRRSLLLCTATTALLTKSHGRGAQKTTWSFWPSLRILPTAS